MRWIILATLLAGCATTARMQESRPVETYSSTRTLPALEECIALRLSWLGNPSTIRGEHRTIMAYGNPTPAFTVTMTDNGPTRNVELRAAIAAGGRVKGSVRECAS